MGSKKEIDMPWKVLTPMSEKKEFIALANSGQTNISVLCRRFGISRKTAYKWINRYEAEGESGLIDKPTTPLSSPNKTSLETQEAIIEIRKTFENWGARKIRHLLDRFEFEDESKYQVVSINNAGLQGISILQLGVDTRP
jgi:transposase-like protein